MNHPSQPASDVCTHERGPSTTVCLHCRREARVAAAERRKRSLLRATTATVAIAVVSAVGALSAKALRARSESQKADANRTPAPQTSETQNVASAVRTDSGAQRSTNAIPSTPVAAPTPVVASPTAAVTPAAAQVAAATTQPQPSTAPLAPTIAIGETSLPDGVVATRTDSEVTLAFDQPMTRTRIPEKFESFVRATLPQVYGHAVDSALAKIPNGGLVRQGDLVSELPTRGIRVPVNSAWTLAVYPETRPGQDGPLVVRYRTAVIPKR